MHDGRGWTWGPERVAGAEYDRPDFGPDQNCKISAIGLRAYWYDPTGRGEPSYAMEIDIHFVRKIDFRL